MNDCLKEPALYVGEIDDKIDLNMPPTSGQDYIKRVVIEAKRCKSIVVAEIDESRLKRPTVNVKPLPGCIEAPTFLSPTADWQQCQIADFSQVRLRIAGLKTQNEKERKKNGNLSPLQLPDIDDQDGWINFCTGIPIDGTQSVSPLLGTLMSMSHPMIERLLEYLVELIEKDKKISNKLGEWIYALLAVLEQPLNPDACSCLRTLARSCSIIRANLNPEFESHQLNTLNLFICLVARYFRQLDLADP